MKDLKTFSFTNERLYKIYESLRIDEQDKKDLQLKLDELDSQMKMIDVRIKELEDERKVIRSVLVPSITITEVTNAVGEQIFIGKYRLYIDSKPQLVTIYIGKANIFNGKEDPSLQLKAKEKALISNKKRLLAKNVYI
jgi:hypothetical protein